MVFSFPGRGASALPRILSAESAGNFFWNAENGLTTAGYVISGIAVFCILIFIAILYDRKNSKKFSVKQLVFAAVAIALGMVLSNFKLYRFPQGGSITWFSMLFVTLVGYWFGPGIGIMGGLAYGLLQMIIDPYIISLPQLLIDYPLAFGALGLSGFFSERKNGLIPGYVCGVLGRWAFATLSGVVFFGTYATDIEMYGMTLKVGSSPLLYSLTYNGIYLLAEGILTVILLAIPPVGEAMRYVRRQARQ